MKSKVVAQRVREGGDYEGWEPVLRELRTNPWALVKHAMQLTLALGELGHLDAVDVMYRMLAAVEEPDERQPRQALTNGEVLSRMAAEASGEPDGSRTSREVMAFLNHVRFVEANRRDTSSPHAQPSKWDDKLLVITLVHFWPQSIGVPPSESVDARTFSQAIIADAPRIARLTRLGSGNAVKLVAAVHRALGYPTTDNILDAVRARRAKSKRSVTK